MSLAHDTAEFGSWFCQATKRLIQFDKRAALRLILSMSLNQFVTVLVFFLPLKVVLLIASDGVPRYFEFFVTEDTRNWWLGGLATAIFLLYGLMLRLDKIAERSASQGARSLTRSAEQVPVTSEPEEFAKSTFYRIGETAGGLIFTVLALSLGMAVVPAIFITIPIIVVVEFALAAVAAERSGTDKFSKFGEFVKTQPQDLLRSLRQINFLLIFGLLLAVFLVFDNLNPLFAIATIMLSRRLFGTMRNIGRNSLKLNKDRALVDVLLFEEAQLPEGREETDREQLIEMALPAVRSARLNKLAQSGYESDGIDIDAYEADTVGLLKSVDESIWVDSGHSGMAISDLYGEARGGERERLLRDYLYSWKASRGLEQHDYLLRFLDSESLRCPRQVARYRSRNLVGRLVEFRGIGEAAGHGWQARRTELLQHLWSLEVPESLVTAYHGTRPQLHERLHREMPDALAVATDEDWAKSVYDLFVTRLPTLCERIARIPLVVFNERLTRRNVVVGGDGRSCLLDWTSWTLRPIGAGIAPERDDRGLLEAAIKSASRRLGTQETEVAGDVLIGSVAERMHRLVKDGYPKSALAVAYAAVGLLDQPGSASLDAVFGRERAEAVEEGN